MNLRKPIIAGNWKMHLTLSEASDLSQGVVTGCAGMDDIEIILAPPYTALSTVAAKTEGSPIYLGAQSLHWEEAGAFTGEISPLMLKDIGCSHTIVSHSERRQLFGETDTIANRKVLASLKNGLIPILCVGESSAERDQQLTLDVVTHQVKEGLHDVSQDQMKNMVIAYEPIWAIGTGQTANPSDAQNVHLSIRKEISELFGPDTSECVRILYGGSVKPDNIDDLMVEIDIDGALVGGASLKIEPFNQICGFERRT